ncbi:tubulin binding cofactor C-domain-containing protein [Bombardia bombarda]|uniref:Tubulin binding cofactor C-domain-containing protein n=1 Tax=Bombardia bombarda TaxID=252184 RepID=A0AA39X0Y8_9PEZI|nr:tubulin binding cofactor C-domain-containing protein [Bombardia bombarda]
MDPKARFYRQFQVSEATLHEQIDQLPSFSPVGGERQDAIENILAGISRLSNEVADAGDYVPAYDQRTYSQALKALSDKLDETTAKFGPKSRFQFKARAPANAAAGTTTTATTTAERKHDPRHFIPASNASGESSSSSKTASEQADSLPSLPTFSHKNYNEEISRSTALGARKPSFSAARAISLSDHAGVHIILPASAARATSAGALTNLSGCVVDMSVPTSAGAGAVPFASLALKDIKRSLIVAGRVSGSVHITGVRDSVLVVVARQVRIHECEGVDVYLWCGSHPIVEGCRGMRFAPVAGGYTTDQETEENNQWDQVDDFKWLKADHSPNWSVLPEGERIPEEVWKNVVPGGPGVGVDDILKKVGLGQRG